MLDTKGTSPGFFIKDGGNPRQGSEKYTSFFIHPSIYLSFNNYLAITYCLLGYALREKPWDPFLKLW